MIVLKLLQRFGLITPLSSYIFFPSEKIRAKSNQHCKCGGWLSFLKTVQWCVSAFIVRPITPVFQCWLSSITHPRKKVKAKAHLDFSVLNSATGVGVFLSLLTVDQHSAFPTVLLPTVPWNLSWNWCCILRQGAYTHKSVFKAPSCFLSNCRDGEWDRKQKDQHPVIS